MFGFIIRGFGGLIFGGFLVLCEFSGLCGLFDLYF